ncbi:379_t:CDS:2, partial [Ambispora leptoticha]
NLLSFSEIMSFETASKDNDLVESSLNSASEDTLADNDEELVSTDSASFIRNVLGSEFEIYDGDLPLITTPIEIEVGTRTISPFLNTNVKRSQMAVAEKEFLNVIEVEDIMSGFQDQH